MISQTAAPSLAVQRLQASFTDSSLLQRNKLKKHGNTKKVDPVVLPDTPDKYEKKESGGVIGLMNKMKEELTADMTEGETEEKFSAKDYVRLMKAGKYEKKESGGVIGLMNKMKE